MFLPHNQPENASLPTHSAILFDLDDTLYDREQAFARWAHSFVEAYFPPENLACREDALTLLITLDAHGSTSRQDLFKAFRDQYPLSTPVEELITTYYQQLPAYIESVHSVLLIRQLLGAHIPFGIVTNGFACQQIPKLTALGMTPLPSCIFISEVFGKEKPDAAIFLAAAACLNVSASQVLFVGDNPRTDIWGAHMVGMKTVWVHRGRQWHGALPFCADVVVRSLQEFIILLQRHRSLFVPETGETHEI